MDALLNRTEQPEARAATNKLLLQVVQEQRSAWHDNQRLLAWTDRQEKCNERQERFNIVSLDEIRGIRKDRKALNDVVLKQHEGRPKRLEDFMDGFLRKAG